MDTIDLETIIEVGVNKIADQARQLAELARDKRVLENLCDKKDKEIRELKAAVARSDITDPVNRYLRSDIP